MRLMHGAAPRTKRGRTCAGGGQIAGLSRQVTTLREQVEQLQQHVATLAAGYEWLADVMSRLSKR